TTAQAAMVEVIKRVRDTSFSLMLGRSSVGRRLAERLRAEPGLRRRRVGAGPDLGHCALRGPQSAALSQSLVFVIAWAFEPSAFMPPRSGAPSGPAPGVRAVTIFVPSGENDDERYCFPPADCLVRFVSAVPSGWAL